VAGTTGYDALRELGHALIEPTGAAGLSALHARWTGNDGAVQWNSSSVQAIREELAERDLRPEFLRLARAIRRETGTTAPIDDLVGAALFWMDEIPFYRDDYPVLADECAAIRRRVSARAGDASREGLVTALEAVVAARD